MFADKQALLLFTFSRLFAVGVLETSSVVIGTGGVKNQTKKLFAVAGIWQADFPRFSVY